MPTHSVAASCYGYGRPAHDVAAVNAHDFTQNLTIKVTGLKGLRFRMWAAGLIFRFGAAVAGTKLEMDLS